MQPLYAAEYSLAVTRAECRHPSGVRDGVGFRIMDGISADKYAQHILSNKVFT